MSFDEPNSEATSLLEGLNQISGPHNNALQLTRREGAAASRPVVEARLAAERECSTAEEA